MCFGLRSGNYSWSSARAAGSGPKSGRWKRKTSRRGSLVFHAVIARNAGSNRKTPKITPAHGRTKPLAREYWWGRRWTWYFGEPLWLQTACGSETLWVYNGLHLAWLMGFVSAGLRERSRDPKSGWSNQALASRLPRWMTSAKNRDRVLKALNKLEIKNDRVE